MIMKYVMFVRMKDGKPFQFLPVMFPEHIPHVCVKLDIPEYDLVIRSAGYCNVEKDRALVNKNTRSTSLDKKCHPDDAYYLSGAVRGEGTAFFTIFS